MFDQQMSNSQIVVVTKFKVAKGKCLLYIVDDICLTGKCLSICFLNSLFQDLIKEGENIEVIFISADGSPEELMEHFQATHGDWLAVQHGAILNDHLSKKFNIRGVPSLIVVDRLRDKILTVNGRSEVAGKGTFAFQQWLTQMS